MKRTVSLASFAGCLLAAALASGTAQAAPVFACLITKTDTNPFFVKMKEGAQSQATTMSPIVERRWSRRAGSCRSRSM